MYQAMDTGRFGAVVALNERLDIPGRLKVSFSGKS
jgi:hypothetical protein